MGITSARKSVIGAIKEDEPPPVSDLVVVQKDVAVIRIYSWCRNFSPKVQIAHLQKRPYF